MQFWAPPGRQDLTSGFLEEIAEQYHELGYGYANILARKYATTPRTVRSWVDRAKKSASSHAKPNKHYGAEQRSVDRGCVVQARWFSSRK